MGDYYKKVQRNYGEQKNIYNYIYADLHCNILCELYNFRFK